MKQPDLHGDLAVKTLYDFEYLSEVDNKVANPCNNSNLYGRPSLIPGVKYPISEREEHLIDLAWQHFCNLKNRGLL